MFSFSIPPTEEWYSRHKDILNLSQHILHILQKIDRTANNKHTPNSGASEAVLKQWTFLSAQALPLFYHLND